MAKKAYIGVDGIARTIVKGYIGVDTEVPIYEGEIVTTNITASNIGDFFTVSDEPYCFIGNGSTFTSNNGNMDAEGTYAKSVWTAKSNLTTVSFDYSVSSEANYDKLTIIVGGAAVAAGISGLQSDSWLGSLEAGQSIELIYSKDGSVDNNDDRATISNIVVTQDQRVIVNSEKQNVARKILKAYIGVGGVARPCFVGGITNYGAITPLSVARKNLSVAEAGDYILFIAGKTGDAQSTAVATVDAYNSDMTRTVTSLGTARALHASGKIGSHAVVGGGQTSGGVTAIVEAFSADLTRTTPTNFNYGRRELAAASNSKYILFAGGTSGSYNGHVDAYNADLSRYSTNNLSQNRIRSAGGSIGDQAVFAGGAYLSSGNSYNSIIVDAFDSGLTRTKPDNISVARAACGAFSNGNVVAFGGGELVNTNANTASVSAVVDTYDASLTKGVAPDLGVARVTVGASIEAYGVFVGGRTGTTTPTNIVDVYDAEMVRQSDVFLTTSRHSHAAAGNSSRIFIGGGATESGVLDAVEALTA